MRRELLQRIQLQRVGGTFAVERDDRPESAQFIFGQQLQTRRFDRREGCLQFAEASRAMRGAILNWPDPGVATARSAELFIGRAVLDEQMAQVLARFSQGCLPAATSGRYVGHRQSPQRRR